MKSEVLARSLIASATIDTLLALACAGDDKAKKTLGELKVA